MGASDWLRANPVLRRGWARGRRPTTRLPAPRLFLIGVVLLASSTLAAAGALWLSGRCRQTRTAIGLAYLLTALFY